jgi:hypothetical protein
MAEQPEDLEAKLQEVEDAIAALRKALVALVIESVEQDHRSERFQVCSRRVQASVGLSRKFSRLIC